jgi:hypothetical protein
MRIDTFPAAATASLTILLRQWRHSEPVELVLDDVVISHPSGYGGPWRYAATVSAGPHVLGVCRPASAEPPVTVALDIAAGDRAIAVVRFGRPGGTHVRVTRAGLARQRL